MKRERETERERKRKKKMMYTKTYRAPCINPRNITHSWTHTHTPNKKVEKIKHNVSAIFFPFGTFFFFAVNWRWLAITVIPYRLKRHCSIIKRGWELEITNDQFRRYLYIDTLQYMRIFVHTLASFVCNVSAINAVM